jgi:phage repressor protein C with HTH and peptisase S24 domain
MNTISIRLQELRGSQSRRAFAEKVNTSESTLRNYENGTSYPGSDFLGGICNKLRISPDWLLLGTGPMYKDEAQPVRTEEGGEVVDETGAQMLFVPLVEARLSAGHGSLETSAAIQRQYAFRASFLRRRGNPAHMVMMRITGDSMAPEIKNRDVVLIDQSQKDLSAGHIYAVGIEDMVYLKMVDAKPGQVILSSFNKEYEPLVIDMLADSESRIRIIGRAIWTCRELT